MCLTCCVCSSKTQDWNSGIRFFQSGVSAEQWSWMEFYYEKHLLQKQPILIFTKYHHDGSVTHDLWQLVFYQQNLKSSKLRVRVFFHLLQRLVVLHVFLGGIAGALRLLLEGFVGGHEWSLLGEQSGQATQQPATDKTSVCDHQGSQNFKISSGRHSSIFDSPK